MQPFASKARAPASGSCDGLKSGWASAEGASIRSQARTIELRMALVIVLYRRRRPRACREAVRLPPPGDVGCGVLRVRWTKRLLEHHFQDARCIGMAHLRVVEDRHAERVLLLHVVELDVEIAAGDELAREYERPGPVLPRRLHGDIAAVSGERSHDDPRHLVPGLVLRVVERLLFRVDDPVWWCRLVALEGELRPFLVVADVVDIPSAGLRVALAAGFRRFVLVVACGVEILVVKLADRAGANALPVPDVGPLAFVGQILVAVRLALTGMARGHAPARLEGRRVDVPDHRELVFVVLVVVAASVVGVLELLPRAVGLLDPRASLEALGRVLVLHQEIHGVAYMHGAERHLRRAAREIPASDGLDRERLRRLPRVAERRLHRRRCGDLLRDQDVLLSMQWSGSEPDQYPRTHHDPRNETRCQTLHSLPPWSRVVATVFDVRCRAATSVPRARTSNALKSWSSRAEDRSR